MKTTMQKTSWHFKTLLKELKQNTMKLEIKNMECI